MIRSDRGLAIMGLYDFWYLAPIYGGYENISIAKTFKVFCTIIKLYYVYWLNLWSKDFKNPTPGSDIALIKLSRPVKYADTINSLCLSKNNLAVVGTQATATGWV